MRILGISGGLRRDFYNAAQLRHAGDLFEADGAEFEIYRTLREIPRGAGVLAHATTSRTEATFTTPGTHTWTSPETGAMTFDGSRAPPAPGPGLSIFCAKLA
jgi:NAD(P)H-dependent FMN reductase